MDLHIADLLQIYKPRKLVQTGRGQWIKQFYYKIKDGWNANKSEPLTIKTVAIRMRNVPDAELPVLWKLCEESSSFTSFFWWRIKKYPPKKREKKPKQISLL